MRAETERDRVRVEVQVETETVTVMVGEMSASHTNGWMDGWLD